MREHRMVALVHLVSFVKPKKPDKPNKGHLTLAGFFSLLLVFPSVSAAWCKEGHVRAFEQTN